MVVDDEPIVLNVVSQVLNRQGYEVLRASGANQALKIIRRKPLVDLVLSDISMPEMQGTDLVREIAQISPQTARVLMTGGIVNAAEVPDGVPPLHKPLSFPDLISAIEAFLARPAQARADLLGEFQKSGELQHQSRQLQSEEREREREREKREKKYFEGQPKERLNY